MKANSRIPLPVFLLASMIMGTVILGSCSSRSQPDQRPVVSVSILPQEYFVRQIAGDLVRVNVMVPPGASPATYEPGMSQLAGLDRSPLYFAMGHLGFELSWMDRFSEMSPEMEVVDLSRNLELIEGACDHDHGDDHGHNHSHGTDPHTWMSPLNAGIMAREIHSKLSELLPAEKDELDQRLEAFLQLTDSLHRVLAEKLGPLEKREFMIYHPSLSYFARTYDLVQHPLELEGKSPSPAHMEKLVDLAREREIGLIFIQKQFDRSYAATLVSETGARLVEFDPLNPDWEGELLGLAEKLMN